MRKEIYASIVLDGDKGTEYLIFKCKLRDVNHNIKSNYYVLSTFHVLYLILPSQKLVRQILVLSNFTDEIIVLER